MGKTRLGEFEILILAALIRLGDDAYGVSVRREIERCTTRSVSMGAVYTALRRLERKGLVTSWMGEPTAERGGRAKRFYRPEAAGKRALEESLRTIDQMTQDLSLSW